MVSSGTPLDVRIEDSSNGASIIAITGELDLSTIPRLEAPLYEQVEQRDAVLVDLSSLRFIDSSGIGVLIEASQHANGTPMRVLIGVDTQVERVFRIAGIGQVLPVFTDRALALAELD
jgi:anti-sigma B factor antagonist